MQRESRDAWAKRVERWKDSGLTAAEFAAELGINAGSLKWWKWRLGATARETPARAARSQRPSSALTKAHSISPLTFVEMSAPLATDVPLEVVLPSAVRVCVRRGFDDETLGRVLDVLERWR